MNNTIPTQYQNVLEAMFCCVEDQTAAQTMSVAQVVEYLDTHGWDDLIDFLNDPRIYQNASDKASKDDIIEVCEAYPYYNWAEKCNNAKADAAAFLAEFN